MAGEEKKKISCFYMQGRNVRIPRRASAGNGRIQEANLKNAVWIGAEAFAECGNLQRVVMPVQLECIARRTFYKCRRLSEIRLPGNLRCIGEQGFCFCGLEQVTLPDSLEEISAGAFLNCKKLREVIVPASVHKIGKRAFSGCNQLKLLVFPGEPEEIGEKIANKTCIIACRRGSAAERYALENGMEIRYLQET